MKAEKTDSRTTNTANLGNWALRLAGQALIDHGAGHLREVGRDLLDFGEHQGNTTDLENILEQLYPEDDHRGSDEKQTELCGACWEIVNDYFYGDVGWDTGEEMWCYRIAELVTTTKQNVGTTGLIVNLIQGGLDVVDAEKLVQILEDEAAGR